MPGKRRRILTLETLERRISLSSITDLPPPEPEGDPGPPPGDDPPIVYPPIPPS